MLKDKKITIEHSNISLKLIKKNFRITPDQELKFKIYIDKIISFNKHTNIVGKSTLVDPWKSHILDCIQIAPYIKKNNTVLDMGTGAGLPGLVLSIMGYNQVSVIDSNTKKINFVNNACKSLNLNANVLLERIEKLNKKKYDFLVCRALAGLSKLFTYSHNFIKKETVLIFLKGKAVNYEVEEAQKKWNFIYQIYKSLSDKRGRILIIKKLELKQ